MQDHLHFALCRKQGNKVQVVAQSRIWISGFFSPQKARVRVSNPQRLTYTQILVNYPLGFKGAMSRGYCYFWSFLRIIYCQQHTKNDPVEFWRKYQTNFIREQQPWYFGDFCRHSISFKPSLAIYGNRQQERVSMPKCCLKYQNGPLFLEFSWSQDTF